jgi:pectinesterase
MVFRLLVFLFLFSGFYKTFASGDSKYDFVVSAKGKYKTIQAAINAAPDNKSVPIVIFIKSGTYSEKVIIPSSKINIVLIGEDLKNTIITHGDYNPKVVGRDTMNTWTSYTLAVDAEGVIIQNLTIENSSGPVGQAVAVRVVSDRVIFKNCRLLGNQDTLFAHGIGRMLFEKCFIEGTTDFIFGSAVALFDNCVIHCKANSFITAASTPNGNPYGFVFKNCTITADSGINKVYLGRPWRAYAKTVFLNCSMGVFIRPEGWHNWNSTEKEKTVFYAEYKNYGPGASIDKRALWSKQLMDNDTVDYMPCKIFSRNSVPIPVLGAWCPSLD